jgi:hypothetical protein
MEKAEKSGERRAQSAERKEEYDGHEKKGEQEHHDQDRGNSWRG